MKLKIYFLTCLTLLAFSCKKTTGEEHPMPKRFLSMTEVKAIASVYDLDSLATEEKNGLLQFMPEKDVHDFFKQEKHALESRRETREFQQRTIWVNSFADYIALIDSLPIWKQEMIEEHGGPEKYQQWIDDMNKTKWHVYRMKQGGIGFEYPDRDDKPHFEETRMDK